MTAGQMLLAAALAAPGGPADLPPEEAVRRELRALGGRVPAWRVRYQTLPMADDLDRHGRYLVREVAARAPNFFYHHGFHGTRLVTAEDDIYGQQVFMTAHETIHAFPLRRAFRRYVSAPTDPLPGTSGQELLFTAVGWWPLRDRRTPVDEDNVPIVLADVAGRPEYKLNPGSEVVGGQPCRVFEWPGRDRLWLAIELGLAVVARERRHPLTGGLLHRVEMSDWRQVAPAAWHPFRLRNKVYDPTSPLAGGEGKLLVDSEIRVDIVQVGDEFGEDLFRFAAPPGAIELNDDGSFRQASPGGIEHVDQIVAWAKRNAPLTDEDEPTVTVRHDRLYIEIIVICILLTTLVWIYRRSKFLRTVNASPSSR